MDLFDPPTSQGTHWLFCMFLVPADRDVGTLSWFFVESLKHFKKSRGIISSKVLKATRHIEDTEVDRGINQPRFYPFFTPGWPSAHGLYMCKLAFSCLRRHHTKNQLRLARVTNVICGHGGLYETLTMEPQLIASARRSGSFVHRRWLSRRRSQWPRCRVWKLDQENRCHPRYKDDTITTI